MHLTLRDGARVSVRPIRPEGRDALRDAFERLSDRSRYQRFLSPVSRLTSSMLTYLTEVDHRDHGALIALPAERGDIGAVARYVNTGHARAEAAVTVADGAAQLAAAADDEPRPPG